MAMNNFVNGCTLIDKLVKNTRFSELSRKGKKSHEFEGRSDVVGEGKKE